MQTKLRATQVQVLDDFDHNNKKITNLAAPTLGGDATNKTYVDGLLAAQNAFKLIGSLDCSANPNYPAASAGDTYVISLGGKVGGASGDLVSAGDVIMCMVDATAAGTKVAVGANWFVDNKNISGGVSSTSGSATDNTLARFDGTSGAIIQNSLIVVDDSGNISIPSGTKYKINNVDLAKGDLGLGSVDNTSDAAKPVSTLQAAAIGAKLDSNGNGSSLIGLTKAQVNLANADNTSDVNKPVSTLQAAAIGAKLDPNGNGSALTGLTKTQVGLANAENTSDANKPISTATATALAGKLAITNYVCRETPTGVCNGSNVTFTLANTPVAGTEMVFLDLGLLDAGAGNDYTISGGVITLLVSAPLSTQKVRCTYWK